MFNLFVAVINGRTEAEVKETVILEGSIKFCPSVRYIIWQRRQFTKFIDINIHKSKYKGTKNCLQNPRLVLNDVDLDDVGDYRIKVKSTTSVVYSNVHRMKILPQKGKFCDFIKIIHIVYWEKNSTLISRTKNPILNRLKRNETMLLSNIII